MAKTRRKSAFVNGGKVAMTPGEVAHADVLHPDHPDFSFKVTFGLDGAVDHFQISRRAHNAKITASAMKSIPVGEILRVARRASSQWHADLAGEVLLVNGREPDISKWADALSERPGRGGRTEQETLANLLPIAVGYAKCVADGDRSPNRTLAEQLGFTESRVRNLVHAARNDAKLLTPTKQGRTAGELTAKARKLLERD